MYNLIQFCKNCRKTTDSLWNYYWDESFKYKTSVTGSSYNLDAKITNAEGNEINNPTYDANKSGDKEVEIAVPLKYLSNFWRALKMPLINCLWF